MSQQVVINTINGLGSETTVASNCMGTVAMPATSLSASTAIAITNWNAQGIIAFMNITSAFPGSASTTYCLKIKAVSPLSTGATVVLGACTPRSSSGQSVLMLAPGIQVFSATTGPISTFSIGVPRDIQIVASASLGATSKEVVLSLGYMFFTV
jgi:hypothetical protein